MAQIDWAFIGSLEGEAIPTKPMLKLRVCLFSGSSTAGPAQ